MKVDTHSGNTHLFVIPNN